mmetsp:Transcript_30466/g.46036  ORF Transcript_30466/g.46036 Transcript_30466/m.46036 type:complete len:87 (-) Transcript_30466:1920-2180(-)
MVVDAIESIMTSLLDKINNAPFLFEKKEQDINRNKDALSNFCFDLGNILPALQPILQSATLTRLCVLKRQSMMRSIQMYYKITCRL